MQRTTTVRPEAEDWQPPTLGFNLQVSVLGSRGCGRPRRQLSRLEVAALVSVAAAGKSCRQYMGR